MADRERLRLYVGGERQGRLGSGGDERGGIHSDGVRFNDVLRFHQHTVLSGEIAALESELSPDLIVERQREDIAGFPLALAVARLYGIRSDLLVRLPSDALVEVLPAMLHQVFFAKCETLLVRMQQIV